MRQKPVKHLADCDIGIIIDANGFRIRDKSICKKCEAYKKCIASQTDRAMGAALHSINKIKLLGG